jgi:hypothetical protein
MSCQIRFKKKKQPYDAASYFEQKKAQRVLISTQIDATRYVFRLITTTAGRQHVVDDEQDTEKGIDKRNFSLIMKQTVLVNPFSPWLNPPPPPKTISCC